jgi:hypothetical protein
MMDAGHDTNSMKLLFPEGDGGGTPAAETVLNPPKPDAGHKPDAAKPDVDDKKRLEIRISELEDENRRLKTPPSSPAVQQKKSIMSRFLSGEPLD